MNKKLLKIFLATVALVVAVTMTVGCTFIDKSSTTENSGTVGYKVEDGGSYVDSGAAAENVHIITSDSNGRTKLEFEDAVSKVDRTSVMFSSGNSAGSGVIVDITFTDDGVAWKSDENMVYIITCHHMVEDMGEIEITLPDENCSYNNDDFVFSGMVGEESPAVYEKEGYAITLVGGDEKSDIALLKLNLAIPAKSGNLLSQDKIVKAKIAPKDEYSVRKGETVFSVGNPTGRLPGSVAKGIVSYLERETSVSDIGSMTLLQIDVSTNPGSSGGGLYNLYGELIGITNAGNTSYTNINFAIPCYLSTGNGFVEITEQLGGTATSNNYGYISGRKVRFGFTVTASATTERPVVSAVESNSQAAASGMVANDIIKGVTINGTYTEIDKYSTFTKAFDGLKIGETVQLTVSRRKSRYREEYEDKQLGEMKVIQSRFCDTGK